jgi:hypothetical protein
VTLLFLFHIRSALIPIITLPIAVVATFIPVYYLGSRPTSCRSAGSRWRSASSWTRRS